MIRCICILTMALVGPLLLFGCGGGDAEEPEIFYGYSFPDPIITNFDTESGKGYLSMSIVLQVGSDQEINDYGSKAPRLKHAVVTFLAKKETQEILPDLVQDPINTFRKRLKRKLESNLKKLCSRALLGSSLDFISIIRDTKRWHGCPKKTSVTMS